ncbi:MAG: adenylate/guanylate cyclase domain-containing protein [Actinomycetota bacterium]|nr:adenylate/guanylate cyclase domain-containing protein [Actinomycetota bacterium]
MQRTLKSNAQVLRWTRAIAFATTTGWALSAMQFRPTAGGYALAVATGVVSLLSPGIAVLVALVALSLPVLAADFLLGAAFLVIGFASVGYLGQDNGRVFLLIMLAFMCASGGPVWAPAIVAGYVFGASEGAVAALLAVLALQAAGLVAGRETIGIVSTGGPLEPLVSFAGDTNLLAFGWIPGAVGAVEPGALLGGFSGIRGVALLAVQPVLWGLGAAVAGLVKRPADSKRRLLFGLVAAVAGVGTLAITSMLALSMFAPNPPDYGSLGAAAGLSLIVALVAIGTWELLFPPTTKPQEGTVQPGSLSAEDADVDELLRLIATAEDQLTAKHTVQATVMITDMKSFSKMTEEEGSVASAKNIQRHRDLLLPVITSHHGKGKSTGGDGLVASFDSPTDAMYAAVAMQQTLDEHNRTHEGERDIVIRVGMADGEVVLDKGGRPFIGNALNLAARVMNLADGGQIYVARSVISISSAANIETHSHGEFELKNIAGPVEVIEVLWKQGLNPVPPLSRGE